MIADGFPSEYQDLAPIIKYRDEPCEIIITKTMLMYQEGRLDRLSRVVPHDSLSIKLTQDPPPQFDCNHGGRGGRFSQGGGRNGGRSKVQCHICSKIGDDAKVYYYRLSIMIFGPNQWRNPIIPP
ncbi:hypothetical protein KIW84_014992 [Lathyrus oleraceus]|uniref:Uncharacterized protein n=1 Tax=Pisum sativum TaxID=3888 RepID=A0A9D5BP42_PEA|nr:hypothetical protein KIW84_014992 [Pisum sativum]